VLDHDGDAVLSEPGRCWRMVVKAGAAEAAHCAEPVVWVGNHRLEDGKQIRVWSCDGHREGLVEPDSVGHR
jgi:hypothetical protein